MMDEKIKSLSTSMKWDKRASKYVGKHEQHETVENSASKETDITGQKRKPRSFWIVVFSIIFVLSSTGVFAVTYVNNKLDKINYNDGKAEGAGVVDVEQRAVIDISDLEKVETVKLPEIELADKDGIFNILLLGTDGLDYEYVDNVRADAIMLMSLNMEDKTAKLVSFERGIGAPITEGEYKGKYDLITHIFAWGGADMVMTDIRDLFRVNVERYVRVNFNFLIKVIDVLGGVDVEIKEKEAWYLNRIKNGEGSAGYVDHGYIRSDTPSEEYDYVVGKNRLTGSMALAYARLRAIDDDWYRIERQRTVIQACANKLKNADIATLSALADEILPMVQTNLTKAEIAALLAKAPDFLGVQFDQLSLPEQGSYKGLNGIFDQGMMAVDFEYNAKLLKDFIYGEDS